MNTRYKKMGAALCAALMLTCGNVQAEEKRIGDLIYVPAMTVQAQSGTYTLRVEGTALGTDSDDAVQVGAVAGAEFGVYVISSSGEVTPWANPLYPSEPMRIRTGEEATRFSLPKGTEFYLRQESAPQGYLFDAETLIPVTQEEIVIQNRMAGQLVVEARDSLGAPLAGVTFTIISELGETQTVVSDEQGQATVVCEKAGVYRIEETELPEGISATTGITCARPEDLDAMSAHAISVHVNDATRTRVTFAYPASGTVQLSMNLLVINDDGQSEYLPLEGVHMEILSDSLVTLTTDETGMAQAELQEGQYTVRLSCDGDVILPVSEGLMIVESGSTTLIELTATPPTGRVAVQASAVKAIKGGSVTLTAQATGETYGPYELDGNGEAVSEPLEPGMYQLKVNPPENMQVGSVSWGSQTVAEDQTLEVEVSAGQLAQVQAQMLTREKQTFELIATTVGETGEILEDGFKNLESAALLSEAGEEVGEIPVEDGFVSVEGLSGSYRLRIDEQTAAQAGVQALSEPFTLPDQQETIRFAGRQARLILASVDENGVPVVGAVYAVTDAEGNRYEVTADEQGEAVTPLLAAGEAKVETLSAPEAHDAAQTQVMTVQAGTAERVQMVHESHGTASFALRMQRLDERGEPSLTVLDGAQVQVTAADGRVVSTLTAGEDGLVSVSLEAGEYTAQIDPQSVKEICRVGGAVRFTVSNAQDTQVELLCYDALGGVYVELVGGELTEEELAQVRFELVNSDGQSVRLSRNQTGFYVGELPEGAYTLRQTQMPQGYTLGTDRSVTVVGGQVVHVDVPLEEYAVLSVSKTGLTFNDSMQTYVVPLTGEYGVYVMENDALTPYPSAQAQMTVWSNVTPEQIARGSAAQIRLPATLEGTTYYLKELTSAQGFATDETYHEVTLTAGSSQTLSCAVSSDRGFFTVDQVDAATGNHVSGGTYELVDAQTLETVLTFDMTQEVYRNPMAIAVGRYILRQTQAAPGYALSAQPQQEIEVQPYLSQGGAMTEVTLECAQIPQSEQMDMIAELYAAQEQGLTLVSVTGAKLAAGESLLQPQLTMELRAVDGTRVDVRSVQLDGAGDDENGAYVARVEYCLADGGWQPSDARMTNELSSPAVIALSDVQDDICAIRLTFLDAQTGEEIVRNGFTPGRITLDVRADSESTTQLEADVSFMGKFAYSLSLSGEQQTMERSSLAQLSFEAEGSGRFNTVPAGRDGSISGMVFFDNDADGVLDAQETSRYAGMTVTLIAQTGEEVESCRTDAQGRYRFDSLSAGTYTVRFDGPDTVAFSSGGLYSAHVTSGVQDTRYGQSGALTIDGNHTDYVVNAGCIYAAQVSGELVERTADNELTGFGGVRVEMRQVGAGDDEEPVVVVTDDKGQFVLSGILPGSYEISIAVPDGYLCDEAQDGKVVRQMTFEQADVAALGTFLFERGASVSGYVRVDDDGDGVIAAGAQALGGVTVKLLRVVDGYTEQVARTVTDSTGAYAFGMLPSGEYSVLFELSGEWAFTRYGENSLVYGAAAQSGSTENFTLVPGQCLEAMDAGVTIPAQLTVSTFKDTQLDGQKGVYEEMLAGVSVTLIRIENDQDAQKVTCVTGEDGLAIFDNVSPGEYVLEYQMPDAWRATRQVDPETTSYPVSCVPQSTLATGRSEPFMLAMGEKDARLYIGAMLSGSISGTVYYDDNANATQDEGEAAYPGVQVELLNADGEVQAQQMSDEQGVYCFEGLAPGRYSVRFTAQGDCGFSATERTMVRGSAQESEEPVSTTRTITIESGDAWTTAHASVVRMASVAGTIWIDSDADSAIDSGEAMIEGVEVALMNGTGRNILYTTYTGADGSFAFEKMWPGTYMLRVSAPDGYVFSGALVGSPLPVDDTRDGRVYSSAFTLLGGARVEGLGYGLYTQGAIYGKIWLDEDYDGLMEQDADGLRGAVLTLYAQDGTQAAQTTSLRSGEFAFEALAPGQYSVEIELPEGYAFTRSGGDSKAQFSLETKQTLQLGEIAMGQTLESIHIGALKPSAVGGVVWMDDDNDGRRQPADSGVANVRVTMTSLDGEGEASMVTDESGTYRFEGVMPGRYVLRFELSDGQAFAKQIEGTQRVSCVPQVDALMAESEELAVVSGKDQTNKDVGVVGVATVEGTVWEDSTYDGQRNAQERGVAGAKVELLDAKTETVVSSVMTDENGAYAIDFVRTGEYTVRVTLPSNMIFTCAGQSAVAQLDTQQGATEAFALAMGEGRSQLDFGAIVPAVVTGSLYVDGNENGTRDADEAGLNGATITMMQGGTVVATCETDAQGAYTLDTLRPGSYRVRVTLPEDTLFAENSPLTLENPDAVEGETPEFEMAMGQQATIETLGTVRTAKISGKAWTDENANGILESAEASLPGTTLELLSFDEQGNGKVVASITVDETGEYAFGDLRSGQYALRVTLPEGMLFADAWDVEGSSCVPVVPGNVGISKDIPLAMGEQKLNVNVGGIAPGSIGDSVWLDLNGNGLQDYREPLIAGVELYLLRVENDGSMQEVARMNSDEYGYYRFADLRPGRYIVGMELREGDTLTYALGGALGEIDSDLDPETGRSGEIQLGSGQVLRNIDIGLTDHAQ